MLLFQNIIPLLTVNSLMHTHLCFESAPIAHQFVYATPVIQTLIGSRQTKAIHNTTDTHTHTNHCRRTKERVHRHKSRLNRINFGYDSSTGTTAGKLINNDSSSFIH